MRVTSPSASGEPDSIEFSSQSMSGDRKLSRHRAPQEYLPSGRWGGLDIYKESRPPRGHCVMNGAPARHSDPFPRTEGQWKMSGSVPGLGWGHRLEGQSELIGKLLGSNGLGKCIGFHFQKVKE